MAFQTNFTEFSETATGYLLFDGMAVYEYVLTPP